MNCQKGHHSSYIILTSQKLINLLLLPLSVFRKEEKKKRKRERVTVVISQSLDYHL